MIDLRLLRTFSAWVGVAGAVAVSLAACLATGGGELESRYATVHNAFSAIGMSEVGPLHEAHLGAGQEGTVELDLASGCTTVVAVGAASILELDAALTDALGTRVARGTAHASEATIRACTQAAATYTLRLKAAKGAGAVLVSTWSGATPVEPATAIRTGEDGRAFGTCESPVPLSAGDFSGTTLHGQKLNVAKDGCGNSTGREIVYQLEVPSRQRVLLALEAPKFDSVLYVRQAAPGADRTEACLDHDAEVACNDDAPPPGGTERDTKHSRIEQAFDPGTYFVFVDGPESSGGGGSYKLHVEMTGVAPLADLCSKAPALADGVAVSGTTEGTFDNVSAPCGSDAHGPDAAYSLAVSRRSRVRVVLHSDDYSPVVHVRGRCDDKDTVLGCADSGGVDHEATFLAVLDPGTYGVFADATTREASGAYTLKAEMVSDGGSGVAGERCRDAIPLAKAQTTVEGDTFAATDDVASQCGGAGAPDQVYRLDLAARAHFTAHLLREEGSHVLALLRGCDGPKQEIGCGKAIDRLLPAGTYFLSVDGASPADFGAYSFEWNTHDTHAQDAACHAPPRLREGDTVNGTTLGGAIDKFSPACATSDATAGGAPDVVYQLAVPSRRKVKLRLHTMGWQGVLSVRRACLEGDAAAMAASELSCQTEEAGDTEFDSVLDAGTYYVVVDGKELASAGAFTLEYGRTR